MIEQIRQIIGAEYANTLGLVVYKNSEIVLEEYFKGANREESVHTFSIVKSIVAILIGIAIDKGYIESVNQRVLDFFPDYRLKRNQEQLRDVTIENFLTMTVPYKFKSEPWTKVCTSEDWGLAILPQIVSEEYINAMLAEHEEGYGYLWWIYPKDTTIKIIRKEYNTGKYDSYCANGVGGSLVAVIPELNAVISMACSLVYNPKPRMELINNYITPYLESLKE